MTHHRTWRVIATTSELHFVDVAARDEQSALARAEKLWDGGMKTRFDRMLDVPITTFQVDHEAMIQLEDVVNEDRAKWAKNALHAFSRETGSCMGSEALHDLLCDLGHYARSIGLDARAELDRAAGVCQREIDEEVQS